MNDQLSDLTTMRLSRYRCFRFLLLAGCAGLFMTACGGGGGGGSSASSSNAVTETGPAADIRAEERIVFPGVGTLGIFDPAVERDPETGRLWMSYSVVEPPVFDVPDQQFAVGLRLAFSDDQGNTWNDGGMDISSSMDAVVGPLPAAVQELEIPADSSGTWRSETSSLVHDPSAPLEERWKLIWHQYLRTNGVSYFFDYSWIALKMAATPMELALAPTVKLLSGGGLQGASENEGAPAFAPVGGPPWIRLHTDLDPADSPADVSELEECVVFGEPSLMSAENALYLSLDCVHPSPSFDTYITLFRCAKPCSIIDSAAWQYLGQTVTPADARDIGHDKFSASRLFGQGGKYFLMLTPVMGVGPKVINERYNGCRVYEFADIDAGALGREAGVLKEIQRVTGLANTHHGACTYHSRLQRGIIISQHIPDEIPEVFRLYNTLVTVP